MVMIGFVTCLLVSYLGLFLFLHRFQSEDHLQLSEVEISDSVAVVIVFRNERENIIQCLQSLERSKGISSRLKVYLIDDHSDDDGGELVLEKINEFQHLEINLSKASNEGKKLALIEVLSMVKESWCFLTDADCEVSTMTIYGLISKALSLNVGVAYGPIHYDSTTFFSKLLSYENMNTQCVGESLLKYGKPAMVNGANTLLSQTMIRNYINAQNLEYASGDDVFFSQSLKNNEFACVYSSEVIVKTSPPNSLGSLIQQRVRWASKYTGYKDKFYLLFPALIFIQNLSFGCIIVTWLFQGLSFNGFLVVLSIKWMIEWTFHSVWFRKYSFRPPFIMSVLLTFLQPFYISFVALTSVFKVSYNWKGRKILS